MPETAAVIFKSDDQLGGSEPYGELSNQILYYDEDSELRAQWYQRAREIRLDPTIALGRQILSAPIIKNRWEVEGEDENAKDILRRIFLPHRQQIMRQAVFSGIDYGWQGWEVVPWHTNNEIHIKYKPLRHDWTSIKVDSQGFPNGMLNHPNVTRNPQGEPVTIVKSRTALCCGQSEYGNPYGRPILKNVNDIFNNYNEVEAGARRYAKKVAGAHWILWYPIGKSPVDGEDMDNADIAEQFLENLKSSGTSAFPVRPEQFHQMLVSNASGADARKSAWHVELIESSAGMDPFLDREKYLDAVKMRGLFCPERVALEGQFGTKAESSEHADIALMAIEEWGQSLVDWHNSEFGFVGRIFEFYGIDYYPGRAYVQPLPFSDDDKAFLREMVRGTVNNTQQYGVQMIDMEKAMGIAGVPIAKDFDKIADQMIKDQKSVAKASGTEASQKKDLNPTAGRPKD